MSTTPVSEERLRNVRAWAEARIGDLSGAEVIVAAIDETLAAREGLATVWSQVKNQAEYQEHHYDGKHDVGVAWNEDRLWVCLDGASLFRAKLFEGKLHVSFTPPEV